MNEKLVLREKYETLTAEAINIIECLDVKDKRGQVTDSGYILIYRVMKRYKEKKDITEQIDIIGTERWERLNKIWSELKIIEENDKQCMKNDKS